jgi:signal peptidase I
MKKIFISFILLFGSILGLCYYLLTNFTVLVSSPYFPKALDQKFIHIPVNVSVLGTGSMAPTFPLGKGATQKERENEVVAHVIMYKFPNSIVLFNKTYYKSLLNRGDLVSFAQNDKKYIKRLIALPGDTIELRGGLIYINDVPQKEPYIKTAHSTFGGSFIKDCEKTHVPENKYFVLGDNRKNSDDSRYDLGFVNESSIDAYLPLNDQNNSLIANWRNTDNDLQDSSKIVLDTEAFIARVNKYRQDAKDKTLKWQEKLVKSGNNRLDYVFRTGDFSQGTDSKNYPLDKAISDAGYWQPVTGEILIPGYYDDEELFNNLTTFDNTNKILLDKDFEELGIVSKEGNVNNCPTQEIIIHLAGWIPAEYSPAVINSWKETLKNLQAVAPGWEDVKNMKAFYESHAKKIDRINEIIKIRIENIKVIIDKMEQKQWLNEQEKAYISLDAQLSQEEEGLSRSLNAK